jgi:UDP-glucose 4-epimerase
MKKVVVFGGSGFLGSYVADELTSRGYGVSIADVKKSPYISKKQNFITCDIMDSISVETAVEDAAIVYNFAGLADIDESIHLPRETMQQNVIGNINILEACRNQNLERYVYASSAYAFSNKGSFYGISKLASEKVIEEYAIRFNLPYSIIRYGSLYGERADDHNGVYRLLRQAIETKKINHHGDGEEMREYIHAVDAATLSVNIVEDEKFVNQHTILTGVEKMRQRDLLRMIQEILNGEVEVIFANEPWEGHYEVTPYSYHPNIARKLVSSSFIDLGQGLVSCIKHIHEKLDD